MPIGMPAMPVTNTPIKIPRMPILLNSRFRSRLNSSSLVSATTLSMPLETRKSRTEDGDSPQIILALASGMTLPVGIVAARIRWPRSLVCRKQNKTSRLRSSGVKVSDTLKPFPSVTKILVRERGAVALGINGIVAPPEIRFGEAG